jgi:hypothetical protein
MLILLFACVSAFLLARIVLPQLSQRTAMNVMSFVILLLTCLSSCGLSNFLKYYYIKKYFVEDPVVIGLKELKKMKK